jgi:folate-binding protein YgfZ
VAGLAVWAGALSFLLQPQGRLDALVRVTRSAPDAVVLDTDAGWEGAVVARLTRFKLRTRADIDRLEWRALALRGPGLDRGAVAAPAGGVVADAPWPRFAGVDLLGPDPAVPAGVRLCDAAAYEALRVRAGVPAMGAELDERTIPAETGLVPLAASFTKGCYTGQELVARMDARSGTGPRHLRRVVSGDRFPVGAEVMVGDKVVATVTSVSPDPTGAGCGAGRDGGAGWVALALVRRDVVPPAEVDLRWEGGRATGRVEEL